MLRSVTENKLHQVHWHEISELWAKSRSYKLLRRALMKINLQIKTGFVQMFKNQNGTRLPNNIGLESSVLK